MAMEAPCPRFTAAEGGTRLAAAARARNTIATEHTAFVAVRLLHEEAYRIRGALREGYQRSVYLTRPGLVPFVAYHVALLTDLTVLSRDDPDTDPLTPDDLADKQVLVCTSRVMRRVLEVGVLTMADLNVLIVDSCHLICKDHSLKYIMSIYKAASESKRPRILALTYPLFTSTKKETAYDFSKEAKDNKFSRNNRLEAADCGESVAVEKARATDGDTNTVDLPADATNPSTNRGGTNAESDGAKGRGQMGVAENYDDFEMYEKLEWKLDQLEDQLCCSADLAEDIDGVKRASATVTKPKELIVEFGPRPDVSALPAGYEGLEAFMRHSVGDALAFLDEHRYDPTEIYGEDMYEEFQNIPDPTTEPRQMFAQFLYILDQLGPYGADKAALSLLMSLEKLKIKVPYERHFLLLCLCTSVFMKIRSVAEAALASLETDCQRIRDFSTPKVLRLIEILTQFEPPPIATESGTNRPKHTDPTEEKPKYTHPTEDKPKHTDPTEDKPKHTDPAEDKSKHTDPTEDKPEHTDPTEDKPKHTDPTEDKPKHTDPTEDKPKHTDPTEDKPKHTDPTEDKPEHTDTTEDKPEQTKPTEDTKPVTRNLLSVIDNLDFLTLGNKIEDAVNTLEANLKELDVSGKSQQNQREVVEVEKDRATKEEDATNPSVAVNFKGFPRRLGHRTRGRGRPPRPGARLQQLHLNPDALCGIVFVKEPLMAQILFMLIVELSRSHPQLGFLCGQYSSMETPADPVAEHRLFNQQRRKHEDVLKKFRMHECNLLVATSALEEGIDLPRCNLVLRWDTPASYRSYGLCRGRARAPRSACVLLAECSAASSERTLRHLATYKELDQIVTRKCGCGIQNEPPQSEEDHADALTPLVTPYAPRVTPYTGVGANGVGEDGKNCAECYEPNTNLTEIVADTDLSKCNKCAKERQNTGEKSPSTKVATSRSGDEVNGKLVTIDPGGDFVDKVVTSDSHHNVVTSDSQHNVGTSDSVHKVGTSDGGGQIRYQVVSETSGKTSEGGARKVGDGEDSIASVDLSTAIALINRYCGKLPSDTFTRLVPQWWTEQVSLPARGRPGEEITAYVCTMRLPLNCPVKYNIVGHPMPTRVLARRMVALQACRILHKSGELDNQLMPIGKDNFRAAELDSPGAANPAETAGDPSDAARPGTTKRRQYYYKRTARAFTDCQPIVDTSDADIGPPAADRPKTWGRDGGDDEDIAAGSQNVLYAIVYTLQCALPERYNTRGRKLHAPQSASQALAILTKQTKHPFQIPAFPVYTRSGEVRVSLERAAGADARISPRRARLVRAFMRFVFAEVLRVRRRGMRLQSEPGLTNNYYIVPTIKTIRQNGTVKIDIDWAFLEVIYKHTEEKKLSELEKPLFWGQEDEETEAAKKTEDATRKNDEVAVKDKEFGEKEEDAEKNDKVTKKNETETNKNEEVAQKNDEDANKDSGDAKKNEAEEKPVGDGVKNDAVTKSEAVTRKPTEESKDANQCKSLVVTAENKVVAEKAKVMKLPNPLLKPGETFHFDAEKYKEAVVTPWYRNQDQPQYFLVAEICWHLTPASAFPSATHATFRSYYESKYGVSLSQRDQPLLDVDHTSARLNLLTPRYVNRKGVALPVSSERTRRAKRDRLDQKQILIPELCRVHPFAAPLWFATVALPCVLYRINALLLADEVRQSVAVDVGLGIPRVNEATCPGFQWPALDFGWSLAEVLNSEPDKCDKKKSEDDPSPNEETENGFSAIGPDDAGGSPTAALGLTSVNGEGDTGRTVNDVLQEKEDALSGFEIGTWSNEMAASIPELAEYDEMLDPLPSNLTFCTSASGGANWCDLVRKPQGSFNRGRAFSMADSDCSYISSDFDTDDSDLNSSVSEEDTDTSGFFSSTNCNDALGVRIEYKTAHEAEAVDLDRQSLVTLAPQPDEEEERQDKREQDDYMRSGEAPAEYIEKFNHAISQHKRDILERGQLIHQDQRLRSLLPEVCKPPSSAGQDGDRKAEKASLLAEFFPYGTAETHGVFPDGEVTLEGIEKHKRQLLNLLRETKSPEELKKLNCFAMRDVDIDAPDYVNEKVANIGFDTLESYMARVKVNTRTRDFVPYYEDVTVSSTVKEFDFDYQPNLEGHPGPSPSLILQALTMSNANDGINLERLETIGDSFLKFAITAYLYCAHPTVHEGKLSHMRSKQVSNLNLYRLGRNKRLGARMIASKFEPHDNWLPPCHKPPATLDVRPNIDHRDRPEHSSGEGCFIPYNLITQHSIPDKSIADCVEALIGAYLLSCGGRGALLFMSWLGLRVLPRHEVAHAAPNFTKLDPRPASPTARRPRDPVDTDSSDDEEEPSRESPDDEDEGRVEWSWDRRVIGSLKPYKDDHGEWKQSVFGELKAPPSPLLRYVEDPEGELDQMLSGYDALERTLQYRFRDRSLLLQAMTHASHQTNRLTDCYQRLEFLGDAILDYLITRHLYEDGRRHSPGALTDLRSALVNNTIFATLAVRHGFHKYFRHMSPGLNEVLTKYVRIQEENGHSISEEHYLIQEDESEQAEDVEVPKALGDLFESVAGAIFLDSGMSLGAVWRSYVNLMGAELEAFSAAAPKSPVRELLEAEPDTAKFGKPERLADGRRVRVSVEVFGRGCFKGIGRNYRIAKGTAARCALRHLKKHRAH